MPKCGAVVVGCEVRDSICVRAASKGCAIYVFLCWGVHAEDGRRMRRPTYERRWFSAVIPGRQRDELEW